MTAAIVPGAMSWPCSMSSASSRDDRRGGLHGLRLAVERDDVAAQVQLALDVALERAQHGVRRAGELRRDLVRKLDLLTHRAPPAPSADTRLPSARVPTFAIVAFMTRPMSFGDVAPVSAIDSRDDPAQLGLGHLGGQVVLDELRLGLLDVGELVAAALAERRPRTPAGACARGAGRRARRRSRPSRTSAAR